MDKITIPYYKWQVVLEEAGESIPVEMGEEMFCKVIELENQISHLYEHIAKLVQMIELHEKNGDVLMQDICKLEASNKKLLDSYMNLSREYSMLFNESESLRERLDSQDICKLEGSEKRVNVPLGLFLDCVYLLRGTAEKYPVPGELIKTMRTALYKMGDYKSEMIAGELYKLLEWEEKSNGNS